MPDRGPVLPKKTILLAVIIFFVLLAITLVWVIPKISRHTVPHTTIRTLPPEAFAYDPAIGSMIAEVSESEISATVAALQDFPTRKYGTPENEQAAGYLHDRLAAVPNLTVRYQGDRFRNVIATLPGRDPASDQVFIVGAHYDSIPEDGEYAPGATDNGCGVAIVVELARVMSRHRFNHTLVFALWNSEELGPVMGSEAFVEEAADTPMDIPLYYNYDAACIDPGNRFVLDIQSNDGAAAARELLASNNAQYGIGFNLTWNAFDCVSDYLVFDDAGYPGIATHSASHGPGHTREDTLDAVSPVFARKNAQLGAAVLAGVAGIRD